MNYGELLEAVYVAVKQVKLRGKATGGSSTTIIDTSLGDTYRDDGLNDHPFFISKSTDGAEPENQYGEVSDYTEATTTLTIPELSASGAVEAGDYYTIMRTRYKLLEVESIVNDALKELGDIPNVDTSLTTADAQTELTLPASLEGLEIFNVEIQDNTSDSDDNRWRRLPFNPVVVKSPGTQSVLELLEQPPSGRSIRLWYRGLHPELSSYSDEVSPLIRKPLAVAVGRFRVLDMLGAWNEEIEESLLIQRAEAHFNTMLERFPIDIGITKEDFLPVGTF